MIQGELNVASSPELPAFFFFFNSLKVLKSLGWGSSRPQHSKKLEEWLLSRKCPCSLCLLLKGQLELTCAASRPYWLWQLVNEQNKYLIVFIGTAGRWGGWTWVCNSEMWIWFPARPQDFCATSGELFTPWMCRGKFLWLYEVSLLLWTGYTSWRSGPWHLVPLGITRGLMLS